MTLSFQRQRPFTVGRPTRSQVYTWMRLVSNALVLGGYFLLLNVDLTTGILVRIIAAALVMPWILENKLWDAAGVLSTMTAIDLHKLFTLMFH